MNSKHSGKFISNLTYDVNHITNMLSDAVLGLFKDSLTLIGLLTVVYQNWKLSDINSHDSFSKRSCKVLR